MNLPSAWRRRLAARPQREVRERDDLLRWPAFITASSVLFDVVLGLPQDAGIPSRVIDELMGHAGGRRTGAAGGSPMGRVYRETTPVMLARVSAALDDRIAQAMQLTANLLREAGEPREVRVE